MRRALAVLVSGLACLIAVATADAATLSGTLAGGKGLQIIVVQATGTGKKVRITSGSGRFRVAGVSLGGASVQIVDDAGAYVGPIVLGGAKTNVYETIKGSGNLALGAIRQKGDYAIAAVPTTRLYTTRAYTVTAKGGRPIGAGRLGRVKVGNGRGALRGYDGPGHDTDLDGIPGVFDVDDNGNLILDNVDRTGRAGLLLRASTARQTICPAPPQPLTPGCVPAGGTTPTGGGASAAATEFHLFSNFKLTDPSSINLYLAGTTAAVQPLIDAAFPRTLILATQIVGATSGTLDCLGNAYCASHATAGVLYPLVNGAAATYAGSALGISAGPTGDAQITPGATPDEIGAGDAFIENAGGRAYPGMLNFAFSTAPAVYSYQTAAAATEQVIAYDAITGRAAGNIGMDPATPILVGSDGLITLKWWRPQRPALAGEASASGWIDIGGLQYTADAPNPPRSATNVPIGVGPGTCAPASYANPIANGAPFVNAGTEGVLDPDVDAATTPATPTAKLLQFTVDAKACFGAATWNLLTSGATFDFDIQARSLFGDNAARKLYFKLQ
ncbi:MAG: hypothetical protein ACR2JV_06935 [Gaiellales bacterium]